VGHLLICSADWALGADVDALSNNGRQATRPVTNAALSGLALLIIVLIFLFKLDWAKI
jgi:hypothetical protein